MKIVLASGSPRRKELLAGLGVEFEVRLMSGIDESYPPGLTPEDTAETIARKKADAYRPTIKDDELLITADTIVCIDGKVLGKPHDEQEAIEMLKTLRGRTHQVVTGVTLSTTERTESFAAVSNVTFSQLTDEEIKYYVETFRPLDKAGAYGIQEWIGYIGVTGLNGSYYNVMGLPVQRIYTELRDSFNAFNDLV